MHQRSAVMKKENSESQYTREKVEIVNKSMVNTVNNTTHANHQQHAISNGKAFMEK